MDPKTVVGRIREALAANRSQADQILERAAEDARALESNAGQDLRLRAAARLRQIEKVRGSIEHHSREIEAAYLQMVEALAATSTRLVEIARAADYSPPPWRGGLGHTVELKLSETREVTVRVSTRSAAPGRRDE